MHLRYALLGTLVLFGSGWARALDRPAPMESDGNPPGRDPTPPAWNVGGGVRDAGPTQLFIDQASFLEAAGALSTETFEIDTTTADCDSSAAVILELGAIEATTNMPALKVLDETCFGNHNTTPDGLKYLGVDTDVSGVSADVNFHFSAPLTALGFYLIDLDVSTLEVTINGVSYPVPPNGEGGETYFGILSPEEFTDVTFQVVDGFDAHYSFDDVAYGSMSPGPVSADEPAFRAWSRVKSMYRQ